MAGVLRNLSLLAKDTRAVTALEYAMIGMLIAGTIVVAVAALGTGVANLYHNVVVAFPG